jgi:CheY-like chemotaxis protein/AcrR family transcriptional regulator
MKVLIAEDEALIRLDVKSVLEEHGFQVCEARDGEEAVEFARDPSVDAAFVDVGMPGLDGIEATRQILAGREIPIVLLTAHANEEVVDRALEAGVSGYLVKPFGERALVPALRTAVERHRELVAAKKRGRVPVRSAVPPRERRDEVLAAAARIFAAKGFSETTVQDIAEAVGVLKGSLYYYFRSKDELLCDVVARADEAAWVGIEQALSLDARAIDRLRACVQAQLASTVRDPAGMALLFQDHASLDDERRGDLEDRRGRYAAAAMNLIEDGQVDRSIVPHVDAALSGVALMEAARGAPDVAATATGLILAGLETA